MLFLFYTLLFSPLFLDVFAITSYVSVFIDPGYLVSQSWTPDAHKAWNKIIRDSASLDATGPWSVMDKSIVAPTGNKHDFVSWAPYYWPVDGCGEGLTPEQIWTQCEYERRDGQPNPDVALAKDADNFQTMSDAVFYNALAWAYYRGNVTASDYSKNVVQYLRTWFLDTATSQTPNLEFAQLRRGPGQDKGTHDGILDLHYFTKIATAILTLRTGSCEEWTPTLDGAMKDWAGKYLNWLETSDLGQQEKSAENNHASHFYSQAAALYLITDQKDKAKALISDYFNNLFIKQTTKDGEQPLEAARATGYHYRIYNLYAIITNARIGQYVGLDVWNTTFSNGASIKRVIDYTLGLDPGSESKDVKNLWPIVGAAMTEYGDATGTYAKFLTSSGLAGYEAFLTWDRSTLPPPPAAATSTTSSRSATSSKTTSSLTPTNTHKSKIVDDNQGSAVRGAILAPFTIAFATFAVLLVHLVLA